jgi:hypothetical protein
MALGLPPPSAADDDDASFLWRMWTTGADTMLLLPEY